MTKNHFQLLGLPERFAIDSDGLRDRLRRFLAVVHPDRHAAGSSAERRLAMQLAAAGNEAFRVLSSPTSRAAYLCGLRGVPVDSERNTAMPPEFLMRQMEWREAIEDLGCAPDPAELQALQGRLSDERHALLQQTAALLDEDDDAVAASARVRELMFHDRLADELNALRRRSAASAAAPTAAAAPVAGAGPVATPAPGLCGAAITQETPCR